MQTRRGAWGVRSWLVFASLFVTLGAFGASLLPPPEAAAEKVLKVAIYGEPLGLNPAHQRGDLAGDHVMWNLFDPLFRWDFDKSELVLAWTVRSSAGIALRSTWRVHRREGSRLCASWRLEDQWSVNHDLLLSEIDEDLLLVGSGRGGVR